MKERSLVIITTRLPPQVCGIGTYSWLLHRHWPLDRSETRFLVIDGAAESAASLHGSNISDFHGSARELARQLDQAGNVNVFLHYAGRAYQRYGCPIGLPRVLQKWKTKFPDARLLVSFHELPGNFPITSRYFWIDVCNRRVVRKLAGLADVIVTNTADHAQKIETISGRRDLHVVPVGSNIEPPGPLSEHRERAEFVIFGLAFGRWQTLQMFAPQIRSWQEKGFLTRLHLVGPRDQKFDARADELIASFPKPEAVVRHGLLPPVEVSKILSRARYGLTNATPANWSKSAVFMACASHGCAVVCKIKSEVPPLCFTVAADEIGTVQEPDLAERTQSLQKWYHQNASWNVIAAKISALLINHPRKGTSRDQ
jgi:hypothetical protein